MYSHVFISDNCVGSVEYSNYPVHASGGYKCDWLLERGGVISISVQRIELVLPGETQSCSDEYVEIMGDSDTEQYSGNSVLK